MSASREPLRKPRALQPLTEKEVERKRRPTLPEGEGGNVQQSDGGGGGSGIAAETLRLNPRQASTLTKTSSSSFGREGGIDQQRSENQTMGHFIRNPSSIIHSFGETSSTSRIQSRRGSRPVLRDGETLEGLFGIPSSSSYAARSTGRTTGAGLVYEDSSSRTVADAYRKLCQSIVDGGAADDAPTWNTVLDMARRATSEGSSLAEASQTDPTTRIERESRDHQLVLRRDFNLLRLHRRAVSRVLTPAGSPPVLDVWLSYASCQLYFGLCNEAKLSLDHVQKTLLGATTGLPYEPSYYLQLANLLVGVGNVDGAIHILELALERQPEKFRREIEERLTKLRRGHCHQQTTVVGKNSSLSLPSPSWSKRSASGSSAALSSPKKRNKQHGPLAANNLSSCSTPSDAFLKKRPPLASLAASNPLPTTPVLKSHSESDDGPTVPKLSSLLLGTSVSGQGNHSSLPRLSVFSTDDAAAPKAAHASLSATTHEPPILPAPRIGPSVTMPCVSKQQGHHPEKGNDDDKERPSVEGKPASPLTVTSDATISLRAAVQNAPARQESPSLSVSFSINPTNASGSLSSFVPSDLGASFHSTGYTNVTTPGRLPRDLRDATPSLVRGEHFGSNLSQRRPWLAASASRSGIRGPPKPLDALPESTVQTEAVHKTSGNKRSDNLDETETETTTRSSIGEDSKSPVRKVKIDISYMWDWDPKRARRPAATETNTSSIDSPNLESKLKVAPSLETIDEDVTADPGQDSADPPSASVLEPVLEEKTKEVNEAKINGKTTQRHSRTGSSVPVSITTASAIAAPTRALSDAEATVLLARTDREFLPLLNKSNVLRVNDVPYLKLGVIGMGGSCKVYSALTKERSVVAIKKVSTSGMDRKVLALYANEIDLLKRLRGNSEIIQMHDSQVDRTRKAIFVVMELGEADLNYVLQRQARSSAASREEAQPSLSMHFIRLTWHQMLSAVRCIHDARIVHGDLKPANFLFVRGVLKLIDFGIAKAIQNDDSTGIFRENFVGTVNYMSPEAIEGREGVQGEPPVIKVGRASDIWSLGCILYEMVYGRTPFADLSTRWTKLNAIINPYYVIPFPETVDPDAIDAMQKCLRRKPEERSPIVGPGGLLTEHCFLHRSHVTLPQRSESDVSTK